LKEGLSGDTVLMGVEVIGASVSEEDRDEEREEERDEESGEAREAESEPNLARRRLLSPTNTPNKHNVEEVQTFSVGGIITIKY